MTSDGPKVWENLVTPVLIVLIIAGSSFIAGMRFNKVGKDAATETPAAQTSSTDSLVNQLTEQLTTTPVTETAVAGQSTAATASPVPTAPPVSTKVNINTAGLAELDKLTGIGPTKAQAIIDYRAQHGPFVSVDDLGNVKGIGPATIEKLRSEVTL